MRVMGKTINDLRENIVKMEDIDSLDIVKVTYH